MNGFLVKARWAALKRHKRRQRDGLWCEAGCPFHKDTTPEEVRETPTGGWFFIFVDNVDRLAKEGVWS